MPTYPRPESPEEIERKLKEGRGSGILETYKPWTMTHEFTSGGVSEASPSHKLKRDVHLFSEGEYSLWTILEYSTKVIDYWEQYPLLDLEHTLKIAADNNIRHPSIPRPKNRSIRDPKVITTDFVVSVLIDGDVEYHPISFKYSAPRHRQRKATEIETLEEQRALEKLEIEKLFWAERGHKLRIVTEKDIPEAVWQNISQALSGYSLEKLSEEEIDNIASYLTRRVKHENIALREITTQCDKQLGYPKGSGVALSVVWHLIAHRKWTIDLTILANPDYPLKLISSSIE